MKKLMENKLFNSMLQIQIANMSLMKTIKLFKIVLKIKVNKKDKSENKNNKLII